jgi:hypothetical protein
VLSFFSSRAVQSQSPQAQGSVPLKSRQWRWSCARMAAGLLEEDYRPTPRATGHERALCIRGFRGRVFLNNAQLYLPGCNHVADQFEPFGTFEDTGYHHRLDLDSLSLANWYCGKF